MKFKNLVRTLVRSLGPVALALSLTTSAFAGLTVCANYTSNIDVACNGIQLDPIPANGCVNIEGVGTDIPWMGMTILFGQDSHGSCSFSTPNDGHLGAAEISVHQFKQEGAITDLSIDRSKIRVEGVSVGTYAHNIKITIKPAN